MAVLSINGLDVPDDFPSAEFEAVCSKTQNYKTHPAHPMLLGALQGTAYRFNALAEYEDKLRASIGIHGPGPGNPYRYQQERDLFGFFSNGFSSLESLAFAMFAVGAIKDLPQFPLATEQDERKVNWHTTLAAYTAALPSDPVISALDAISTNQDFKDFYLNRNILTHRAAPPRAFSLSAGDNRPNMALITRINIRFEVSEISSRRQKIASLLLNGFRAMHQFVQAHL